jgi:large subunit ribosomal protein L29
MIKAQELRDKSDEELEEMYHSLLKEIFDLRSQRLDTKNDKTHLIGQKRKEIARLLTIKRQRELAQKQE